MKFQNNNYIMKVINYMCNIYRFLIFNYISTNYKAVLLQNKAAYDNI